MKLRTIALLAAIAYSICCLAHVINDVHTIASALTTGGLGSRSSAAENIIFLVSSPIRWIAQGTLAFFFFFLYAKQQNT